MIAPATATAAAITTPKRPPFALTVDVAPFPVPDGFALAPAPDAVFVEELVPVPLLPPEAGPVVGVIAGAVKSTDAVAAVAAPVIRPGPWCVVAVKYRLTAV